MYLETVSLVINRQTSVVTLVYVASRYYKNIKYVLISSDSSRRQYIIGLGIGYFFSVNRLTGYLFFGYL